MKHLIFALLILSGILSSSAAFLYGFDREMARRDYENAINNGDFEKSIVGCIFENNCQYYTDKLYDYE